MKETVGRKYDTDITFIDEAKRYFEYLLTKPDPIAGTQYEKGKSALKEISTLPTHYHNKILLENKDSFGVDYKTFPFVLDQGRV